MSPRSELEWLGLEAALRQNLPGRLRRPLAQVLVRLCRGAGVTHSHRALLVGAGRSTNCIPVYICLLREALRDVGCRAIIATNEDGYWISEGGAKTVWAWAEHIVAPDLDEEAA